MATDRPAFLAKFAGNAAEIIEAFKALPAHDARAVDKWLLVNSVYGSVTWQEQQLFAWINANDEV